MSTTITQKLTVAGAVLAGALLLSAPGLATPMPLPAPTIPGVAPLPGPIAAASTPAANMGILKTKPDIGAAGTSFSLAGSGLGANKDVSIVWNTANVTWMVDARPDSVDYLGRKVDKVSVVLAQTKTDAQGAFSLNLKAPKDFGGIHDMYAVVDGVQLAKGGFLIARTATMTPKKGPIGTMITLRYSGLGSSLYEGGASMQYDNHYVGAVMANWTRGVATVRFRASGPVGRHIVEIADAISFDYLNIPQSPIPWAVGHRFAFKVTKDAGLPKQRLDWPVAVAPTIDARTTLSAAGLGADKGSATLSSTSGPILSKVDVSASGLTPSAPVSIVWSTVVGNRVNCSGTCWSFVSVPLANGTATADGSLKSTVEIPDGLGGWHVIQLLQAGNVKAQVPYFVKRSVAGISALKLKAGQKFTVHLKGVGWTQLDNTIAVDYDNSYIGYGCGFNSNGDVVLNLVATRHAGDAPDRHVPAAVHAAAVVRQHALRHGACAHVRAGRSRACTRLQPAGNPAGNPGGQVASGLRRGRRTPFPAEGARGGEMVLFDFSERRAAGRAPGGAAARSSSSLARPLDAARAALPLARPDRLGRGRRRRRLRVACSCRRSSRTPSRCPGRTPTGRTPCWHTTSAFDPRGRSPSCFPFGIRRTSTCSGGSTQHSSERPTSFPEAA